MFPTILIVGPSADGIIYQRNTVCDVVLVTVIVCSTGEASLRLSLPDVTGLDLSAVSHVVASQDLKPLGTNELP